MYTYSIFLKLIYLEALWMKWTSQTERKDNKIKVSRKGSLRVLSCVVYFWSFTKKKKETPSKFLTEGLFRSLVHFPFAIHAVSSQIVLMSLHELEELMRPSGVLGISKVIFFCYVFLKLRVPLEPTGSAYYSLGVMQKKIPRSAWHKEPGSSGNSLR